MATQQDPEATEGALTALGPRQNFAAQAFGSAEDQQAYQDAVDKLNTAYEQRAKAMESAKWMNMAQAFGAPNTGSSWSNLTGGMAAYGRGNADIAADAERTATMRMALARQAMERSGTGRLAEWDARMHGLNLPAMMQPGGGMMPPPAQPAAPLPAPAGPSPGGPMGTLAGGPTAGPVGGPAGGPVGGPAQAMPTAGTPPAGAPPGAAPPAAPGAPQPMTPYGALPNLPPQGLTQSQLFGLAGVERTMGMPNADITAKEAAAAEDKIGMRDGTMFVESGPHRGQIVSMMPEVINGILSAKIVDPTAPGGMKIVPVGGAREQFLASEEDKKKIEAGYVLVPDMKDPDTGRPLLVTVAQAKLLAEGKWRPGQAMPPQGGTPAAPGQEDTTPLPGGLPMPDSKLMDAIRDVESSGDPHAVNKDSGAIGAYQFMPATAARLQKEYGEFNPFNAQQSRRAASYLIASLMQKNGGDLDKTLADYAGYVTKDPTPYIQKVKARMAGQVPGATPAAPAPGQPAPVAPAPAAAQPPIGAFRGPSEAETIEQKGTSEGRVKQQDQLISDDVAATNNNARIQDMRRALTYFEPGRFANSRMEIQAAVQGIGTALGLNQEGINNMFNRIWGDGTNSVAAMQEFKKQAVLASFQQTRQLTPRAAVQEVLMSVNSNPSLDMNRASIEHILDFTQMMNDYVHQKKLAQDVWLDKHQGKIGNFDAEYQRTTPLSKFMGERAANIIQRDLKAGLYNDPSIKDKAAQEKDAAFRAHKELLSIIHPEDPYFHQPHGTTTPAR